jgi:hypothetical protein
MRTSHEDQSTFFITSRSVLLRMKNVSEKSRRENQNKHFISVTLFFENTAFYEITHKIFIVRHATVENIMHAHCMLDT